MLEFSRPQWLFLLLALPGLIWVAQRLSYASLGPWQSIISQAVRTIIWVLLCFSVAGAQFVRRSDRMSVIVVRDASDSMDKAQFPGIDAELDKAREEMRKDDTLGKVNFGADAYIEFMPQPGVDKRMLEAWQTSPRGNFTDIGEALQLALASFPANAQKRLVLVTDGNENTGNALPEVRAARDRGVEIIPVPLSSRTGPEVVVDSLEAPSQASIGEKVNVRFVLNSTVATKADVTLIRNGAYVDKTSINVRPGKDVYEFPVTVDRSGFFTYELAIEPQQDTIAENNKAYAFTVVEGQPRLLYATGDAGELAYLPKTLRTHNIAVDVVPPSGIPYSLEDFQVYDGIIFSDVAAFDISTDQMKMIQSLVRDFGRGFMMLGGEKSFGPGGYFETPIEETLPVNMDFRRKRITPSTLVVCLVDKSGSMGETVNGVEKIVMAREACKEVVKLQQPNDWVGVMGFDSMGQWVVQPTRGINKDDTLNKLSSMQAGGGTDLYPALEAAYLASKSVPVQIKHFVVFTDGMVAPADFQGLCKRLTDDKVTVSTVAFGTDADIPFMKDLAKMGGGNMYEAKNIADLPRIFTREVFLANKATLNEDPFYPKLSGDSPLTAAISWGGSPPLYGYVATSAKDRAQVPLLTQKDDPLLAVWRYGLGKSAAFTSDAKNRWAKDWLGWGGYEQFFTGLARWIRSDLDSSGLDVSTTLRGRDGVITATAVDDKGKYVEGADLEARVTDPELGTQRVRLQQTGPGEYEGHFEVRDNGNYFVNAVLAGKDSSGAEVPLKAQAGGLAVSYSPEYKDITPNTFLLAQLAEGSTAPAGLTLDHLFSFGRKPQRRLEDAWELFTLIALLLWLLDVAVRRLALDPADLKLAWSMVLAGPGAAKALRTQHSLAGLMAAKRRAEGGLRRPGRAAPEAVPAVSSGSAATGNNADLRRRLDTQAQRQKAAAIPRPGAGAGTGAGADAAGEAGTATPTPAPSGDLNSLRRKLDAKPAAPSPGVSWGNTEVSSPAPAPEKKPAASAAEPLSDKDFTSRLLERKRKGRDGQ